MTPNLQIGTVTTLPAGSPATAEITGTAANPVLSFGLPRGADATGGSAGVTTINGLDGAVKLPVSGAASATPTQLTSGKCLPALPPDLTRRLMGLYWQCSLKAQVIQRAAPNCRSDKPCTQSCTPAI